MIGFSSRAVHRVAAAAAVVAMMAGTVAAPALAGTGPESAGGSPEAAHRVPFDITLDGVVSNLALLSTTILPGEAITLGAPDADTAHASAGRLEQLPGGRWSWTAPQAPGLAEIRLERGSRHARVQVFVLTPWENGSAEALNGFRIGTYARKPLRDLQVYLAPKGFIELREDMAGLAVSPHFTLGQFRCKQPPGEDQHPYLLVRTAMLVKLERLLDELNAIEPTPTLTVMSGFRTPWYNAAIGNRTVFSRHLYGGAADVFVDRDGDGRMDDLDGNGRSDVQDAVWLADLAERIARSSDPQWPAGGVGVYPANAVHGPFVHVDARGFRARWGR